MQKCKHGVPMDITCFKCFPEKVDPKVLTIFNNDGTITEVKDPPKPAWPCHYGQPCSCDKDKKK